MRPLGWALPEPGTRGTALKVTKSSNRPHFDAIVVRSRADWITGGPEPETSGPQNLQIFGALDALLRSTLSGRTESVNL